MGNRVSHTDGGYLVADTSSTINTTPDDSVKYLVSALNMQKYGVSDGSIIYVGSTREYTSLYDAVLASYAGVTIVIDAGEYLEEAQIEIPVGVNITGSSGTIIKTNYAAVSPEDAFLMFTSADTGEDGNQTISNITFDGEFNGGICARVWCRDNVIFQNCTVKNFTHQGIRYQTNIWWAEPTYYATGNIVRNCVFRDCSRRIDEFGQGAIWCGGQSGFEVHDNEFYLEDMPQGQNGNMMIYSWVQGLKYYDNVSWKALDEGEKWNMGFEGWNSIGGNEIYNNTFNGGGRSIDIAGASNTKGAYDYSWWIHHNTFTLPEQIPVPSNNKSYSKAVTFESTCKDAIVSYNHIINVGTGFVIDQAADVPQLTENITFCYNLLENIGYSDTTWGNILSLRSYRVTDVIQNIFVYNNTYKGYNSNNGIRVACFGTTKDVYIYNNIIEGVKEYIVEGAMFGWLYFDNSVANDAPPVNVSNFFIRNNIIHDNVNNNAIYYDTGISVTNLVEEDNSNSDPKYVTPYTDFHLQSDSPAVDAGINVDLDVDLDGEVVGSPPCIGVYEYVS